MHTDKATNFARRGFLAAAPLLAQPLLPRVWTARCIAAPKTPPADYGVYYFRRTFEIANKPERFLVHVSGDNRYQLFVNGRRIVNGHRIAFAAGNPLFGFRMLR